MVTYRGPKKDFTKEEIDEIASKPHSITVDKLGYMTVKEDKRKAELEQSKKKFDKLYAENRGKIPNPDTFPESIFDLLKKREKRP
jgi:hypothetical protein